MKILMILPALFLASNVYAVNFGDTTNNHGGTANANAGAIAGANAVSVSKGGNAYAKSGDNFNRNSNYGVNSQHQGQNQGQSQSNKNYNSDYSSNLNKNSASQGQVSKVNNEITVEGDEINAEPAYAPNVVTGNSNLTCNSTVGGSVGGGGIISLGASFTSEDEQCTARANTALILEIYGATVAKKYAEAHIRGLADIVNPEEDVVIVEPETQYIAVNAGQPNFKI